MLVAPVSIGVLIAAHSSFGSYGCFSAPWKAWRGPGQTANAPSARSSNAVAPDMAALAKVDCWAAIVTAPGENGVDFVSRFFAPARGVPEDPVTGSAHCTLVPYWATRLNKTELEARQISRRGGALRCTLNGDRVGIGGRAVVYLEGKIEL